ncbi:MAG: hypothetical protein JNN05_09530, partial [Candidatus Omnitrophica bacterium]|nr:hypothetical protein [Candidatus Omnitrophota bacterium]
MVYEKNKKLNVTPPRDHELDPNLPINQVNIDQSNESSTESFYQSSQNTPENIHKLSNFNEKEQFQSKFKGWIRAVALVVLAVFIPDQVSWAFNYNPAVLYSRLPSVSVVNSNLTPAQLSSAQIAQSVDNLLNQIANKENTRLELKIDDAADASVKARRLIVDSNTIFTAQRISDIKSWLSRPDIHSLNCGIYALTDILKARGIKSTLEEASVLTLTVDLMGNIIKPGEPKLKTSLFAIEKVAQAYCLKYQAVKIDPSQLEKLKTPFIANFKSEHFVTVTKIENGTIDFLDIGRPDSLTKEEFLNQFTGYVLTSDVSQLTPSLYKEINNTEKSFVWGSKYRDRSSSLPGLMSNSQIAIALTMNIGMAALSMIGTGPFGVALMAYSLGTGMLSDSLVEMHCLNKAEAGGSCTGKERFMMGMGIRAGFAAVAAGMMAATSVAKEGIEAGKEGAKQGVSSGVDPFSDVAVKAIENHAAYAGKEVTKGVVATSFTAIKDVVATIGTAIGNILSPITQAVVFVGNKISNAITFVGDSITSTFKNLIGDQVKKAVTTVLEGVLGKELVKSLSNSIVLNSIGAGLMGGAGSVLGGYVQYEIAKGIQKMICPNPNKCGDAKQILIQTLTIVAGSIGAQMANATLVTLVDSSLGTSFGRVYGAGEDSKSKQAREVGEGGSRAENETSSIRNKVEDGKLADQLKAKEIADDFIIKIPGVT